MAVKLSARDKRNFNEMLKSARIGHPEAQYEVGLMYANGVGVAADFEQALGWIRQSAERGVAAAQYLLANSYASGSGLARDDHRAIWWYQRAAEQGHAKSIFRLGRMYSTPHPEQARACYAQAAELGLADAQWALACALLAADGAERDEAQAARWCLRAAEQGLVLAQHLLGGLYARGQGVTRDPDRALAWYRRAARQNHAPSQVAIEWLDTGQDVRRKGRSAGRRKPGAAERRGDPARWDKAAEHADADARYHLGLMYELGIAVGQDASQARFWYLAAAGQGELRAQLALAKLGESEGDPSAVDWYHKAAEQGAREAQFALGRNYLAGQHLPKHPLRGVFWYLRAAEQGDTLALLSLGHLFAGPLDPMARDCFERAADQGVAQAQYWLGQHHSLEKGSPGGMPLAVESWRQAAEQGHADAQCALAGSLLAGNGVERNFQQALEWFQKAAEQGHAKAQWNLGSLYASGGPGLKRDLKRAFVWCQSAADLDFVPAQATLGGLFARIDNPQQAVAWWTRAAQKGDAEAQYNLAMMCSKAQGVDKDGAGALFWFGKAAAQGLASAQSRLGLMYATGNMVPVDPIEAHKWFALAALAGDVAGRTNCARSESRLEPAQLAEAQRRVAAWIEARAGQKRLSR